MLSADEDEINKSIFAYLIQEFIDNYDLDQLPRSDFNLKDHPELEEHLELYADYFHIGHETVYRFLIYLLGTSENEYIFDDPMIFLKDVYNALKKESH